MKEAGRGGGGRWEDQLVSMDLVLPLGAGSQIQPWRQLQVGGREKPSGGDFRAERGLEGFGTRTHLVLGLGALKTDWKLGGER